MRRSSYRRRSISLLCCLAWTLGACMQSTLPVSAIHSPLLGSYRAEPFPGHQPAGRLILADTGLPTAPNPLFAGSRFDLEMSSALWAAPVVYDAAFHVQPDQLTEVPLPENGDVQDGGKTIIMHLRHDLRWSDGQPILASDFAYWWNLDQNPDSGALATSGYDQIASITTPDVFTVVLHMKLPFGPYLSYLPYAAPEHAWSHFRPIDLQNQPSVFQAPAVTDGPYKLALFTAQQSYTLVPNPYYRSTTFHGPFLSQLIYRAYSTPAALSAALQSGQIDVAEGYTENENALLAKLPANMRVQITPAAAYEHLDFNLARPFFQDLRVRQAFQLAIDRCGILKDIVGAPDCARAADQVEPTPSLVNDPAIHASRYDPRAARQLLAAAGWIPGAGGWLYKQGQPSVVRLVTTSDNPLRAAVVARLQQELGAVGIQVKLAFYDLSTFFGVYSRGGVLATGAYDLALFGYANAPEPNDEYTVFHSSQIPSADNPDLSNYGRIADPIIDQSLDQGRDTVAFSTRVQAYHRFLERLASQVYLIPFYTDVNILIVKTDVKNVLGNPNTLANNWNIADWWISG
ncbi:MAG TPA: peptide ABC transporter substrate-binding protein [Ktedonobacteraceae bacterium]